MSDDLDALADHLSEFDVEEKVVGRSPLEERVIAGFEDIQRFVEREGHPPQHGEEKDIFERLYAARLERLAGVAEYRVILEPIDHQGLLQAAQTSVDATDDVDLDELAADLAGLDDVGGDITELRHVRPVAEKKAAEEIANREPCADFDKFKPLFDKVQSDLDLGLRITRPFERKSEIEIGRFFNLKRSEGLRSRKRGRISE